MKLKKISLAYQVKDDFCRYQSTISCLHMRIKNTDIYNFTVGVCPGMSAGEIDHFQLNLLTLEGVNPKFYQIFIETHLTFIKILFRKELSKPILLHQNKIEFLF